MTDDHVDSSELRTSELVLTAYHNHQQKTEGHTLTMHPIACLSKLYMYLYFHILSTYMYKPNPLVMLDRASFGMASKVPHVKLFDLLT